MDCIDHQWYSPELCGMTHAAGVGPSFSTCSIKSVSSSGMSHFDSLVSVYVQRVKLASNWIGNGMNARCNNTFGLLRNTLSTLFDSKHAVQVYSASDFVNSNIQSLLQNQTLALHRNL